MLRPLPHAAATGDAGSLNTSAGIARLHSRSPGTETSPVNSLMGPHTIMAARISNASAPSPAPLACLLHNKITGVQSAKGGRQIGWLPSVSKPYLAQGSPLLILMRP